MLYFLCLQKNKITLNFIYLFICVCVIITLHLTPQYAVAQYHSTSLNRRKQLFGLCNPKKKKNPSFPFIKTNGNFQKTFELHDPDILKYLFKYSRYEIDGA